jgi:mono/diheme cytochrome c family protein
VKTSFWFPVLALLGTFAVAPAAWAFGDPEEGQAIAERWCSNCHIVSADKPAVATDAVPTFPSIARKPGNTPQRIGAFLIDPHPPMPNFNLSKQTIEHLVAYFESLGLE